MNSENPMRVPRKLDMENLTLGERRSYSKPVLESHLDLLKEGTFSDVDFIVGPSKERVPCHQLFLKARSPVFEVMFNERWDHDKNKEVPLKDVDPQIFRKFLEFIYSDTFVANVSEALELLQVAHKYDVQLLVSKCEELLESEVTLDDAVDVFQAARKYDKIQLMDKVGDLMAKSLSNLQSLPSFSRVDKQTLMYILKRDDLNMKEVDLFRLAVQWANNQPNFTMQQKLEDILPLIRFPIMTLQEFTKTVVPTGLLPQSTIIDLFTFFGTNAKARKSLAITLKFSTKRRLVDTENNQLGRLACASVALYSEKLKDCKILHHQCLQLREHLEFHIQDIVDRLSLNLPKVMAWDSGVRSGNNFAKPREVEKKTIGLSSISVYCPTTTAITNQWPTFATLTNTFKIVVKVKSDLSASYEDLHTWCNITAEEGKLTELIFDKTIPIKRGLRFCIIAEEMTNPRGMNSLGQDPVAARMCNSRDFGKIRRHVYTTFGQTYVHFEFEEPSLNSNSQLIYKLGLRECQ